MNFIQVLNDPEGKQIVEQLEDISVSLRGRTDAELERIQTVLIDELWAKFGFQYTL